jgi:hypothetical protein
MDMAGRNNDYPRFSPLADPYSAKVANAYRGFFSRFIVRKGPPIPDLDTSASGPLIAATVNSILAEWRAQGMLDPDEGARAEHYFSAAVKGVTLIPATGDFAYATTEVRFDLGDASYTSLNRHSSDENTGTDFSRSLDELQSQLPNCGAVSIFAAWFGDNLRAEACTIQPKVDSRSKITEPLNWQVSGTGRGEAAMISTVYGQPAYGSTPSDNSILEAISDLKQRDFTVAFTPFLLMDIPSDRAAPAYPWRGRITAASDMTPAAANDVQTFSGSAQPKDFYAADGTVYFTGAPEWSYRRFILHYAHLCASAGGVDIFVVGSEMRGLTRLRSGRTAYPFVDALVALAADVRAILPGAKIVYAADWSEYFGHQPVDGFGDAIFHLDPLWASEHIAAVAFDNYWPLADWRDGSAHLDAAKHASIYDFDYLQSNIEGGEGYEWYYASSADRDAQIRTPITDSAYNRPWMFRYKDIRNWWLNHHYNRIGGVEQAEATAWVPESKPFWFMECGCPAVNKGANQPNVFVDPKSSESALPCYSLGMRDDYMQRRHLHSLLRYYDPADSGFIDAHNPVSTVYGGRMVDTSRIFLYTWDARAYEVFPARSDVWSDADNWTLGQWLTGRIPDYQTFATAGTNVAFSSYAPGDPYVADPKTGALNPHWRDFFEGIQFARGAPIANLSAEPAPAEIAAAVNALLAVLRNQNRIAP